MPERCRSATPSTNCSYLNSEAKGSKTAKDLQQAAILIAKVAERFPGAIQDALRAVPKSAAKHVRRALQVLPTHLPADAEAAWESLRTSN
jgi:hypothetical protein